MLRRVDLLSELDSSATKYEGRRSTYAIVGIPESKDYIKPEREAAGKTKQLGSAIERIG